MGYSKGSQKYDLVEISQVKTRLYYEPAYMVKGLKPYNLDRFGIYVAPFRTCGKRSRDKRNYNRWLIEIHGYCIRDFPEYELHHTISGRLMLIPYEVHKVRHLGGIGLIKYQSFAATGRDFSSLSIRLLGK